ncbi:MULTISPECIES: hypothetical protein [Streptomyces]|uniref:Uncharacterized protein n=1 Tax=Streptomyces cyaneofuscatus TaxID=66883 RepID=A0ABZ1EYM3_9ACTN|nr:hypothetical protein [Streptomyces cyaneofuscatus]WSB09233.1 hypothetical protein OG849_19325 [Streptomyces cyaneofuscatus]WSD47231.1 hypothetical protein OG857_16075 [Streptomyces cyaneofuscatus]WTA90633.1 hypothetical protein OG323_17205 [Streptomyces cyaneofuscatus]
MTEQQTAAPAPAEPAEAAPPTAAPAVPDAPRPPRRALRAVARWTAALLVFGGLGTGTALAITSAERTDVPGLATEDDGRWEYPQLSLPALPAGSPRPFTDANNAEIHHADLRKLLLPAPAGATPDKTLDGGWVKPERFLAEYRAEGRDELDQILVDTPPRHIAARGWTMPDGTRARIYLVRFNSTAFATYVRDTLRLGFPEQPQLVGVQVTEFDKAATFSRAVQGVATYVHTEQAPHGDAHSRQAYSLAGDTLALIVHERPGKAEAARIPFHQTVILQNQLLG